MPETRYEYYGHSLKGHEKADWQTLQAHLAGTAQMSGEFAEVFSASKVATLLGQLHDLGKSSKVFQKRLEGARMRVDHSTAAGLYLRDVWGSEPGGDIVANLLSYALLGHHGGLPDCGSAAKSGSLLYRLADENRSSVPQWDNKFLPDVVNIRELLKEIAPMMCMQGKKPDAFATSFLVRMLYSCLVDADFLDTERFCAPERYSKRGAPTSVSALEERLTGFLKEKGFLGGCSGEASAGSGTKQEQIAAARHEMLHSALNAADLAPGFFTLTMPTGGGKTLSSMAFALRHARIHGLKRVIMVVPYTSIIEQNAAVYRAALGEDAVLEHHSGFITGDEDDGDEGSYLAYRLCSENWNASVIVTTSVQFFESLFANKSSRCRKLHNIAESVVILDEAQMIPVNLVSPCINVLRILAEKYRTSVVLCTATQPALVESEFLRCGIPKESVRPIIPEHRTGQLFDIFRRTRVHDAGTLTDEVLLVRIQQERQCLCIVNSRNFAKELYGNLPAEDGNFHLSALMTPMHRTRILEEIRSRLTGGETCRVISTSLIECGVDISFPTVYREENGLDVLAQAAGRCNREGKINYGNVYHFLSTKPEKNIPPELNRRRSAFCMQKGKEDLFSPETINDYFYDLYKNSNLDEKDILSSIKESNSSGKLPWRFDFEDIAKKFMFIDQDMLSIIVENEETASFITTLRNGFPLSAIEFRKLRLHSVQVYRHEFTTLQNDDRIETLLGFIHILSGGIGYDKNIGLMVNMDKKSFAEQFTF